MYLLVDPALRFVAIDEPRLVRRPCEFPQRWLARDQPRQAGVPAQARGSAYLQPVEPMDVPFQCRAVGLARPSRTGRNAVGGEPGARPPAQPRGWSLRRRHEDGTELLVVGPDELLDVLVDRYAPRGRGLAGHLRGVVVHADVDLRLGHAAKVSPDTNPR